MNAYQNKNIFPVAHQSVSKLNQWNYKQDDTYRNKNSSAFL